MAAPRRPVKRDGMTAQRHDGMTSRRRARCTLLPYGRRGSRRTQAGAIMGGSGSGDWQDGRPLTRSRLPLDVRQLRRAGLVLAAQPTRAGHVSIMGDGAARVGVCVTVRPVWPAAGAAVFDEPPGAAVACHVHSGADRPPYRVALVWRRVGYGWRPFWRCPRCDRAASILYGADGWTFAPRVWACRDCAGLAYLSTLQPADVRADAMLRRAAAALGVNLPAGGWAFGMLDRMPPRPPGMRRATYRRRLERLRSAKLAAGDAWMAAFMGSATTGRMLAMLEAERAQALDPDDSRGADAVRDVFAAALAKHAR